MFNKILPMTGVEPRTSVIEIDRSTNWATTTSPPIVLQRKLLSVYLGRYRRKTGLEIIKRPVHLLLSNEWENETEDCIRNGSRCH